MVLFRHGRLVFVNSAAMRNLRMTPGTFTKIGPCVNCYNFIIKLKFLQDFLIIYFLTTTP